MGCASPTPSERFLKLEVAPVTAGAWPRPDRNANWQWQLTGTPNLGYDVDVYDLDLFEAPEASLQTVKQAGRSLLCYFSAGSGEDWRPDFNQIPQDALGKKLDGWPGERWLDLRREEVFVLMKTRLDLAVSRGCDGVEPDNVDGHTNKTGFDLTYDDVLAFNRNLANAAHERGLFIALKNDGSQAKDLVDYFDLELNEECLAFNECGDYAVFGAAGKPVFNAEYPGSEAKAQSAKTDLCARANAASLRSLLLPLSLDDSFRVPCF